MRDWLPTILTCLGVAISTVAGLSALGPTQKVQRWLMIFGAFVAVGSAIGQQVNSSRTEDKLVGNQLGGDSFCHLQFFVDAKGRGQFFLTHEGEYPLYGVQMRVIDGTKFAAATTAVKDIDLADALRDAEQTAVVNLAVGDIPVHSSIQVSRDVDIAPSQELNIHFSARNGFWSQIMKLRKIDGQWNVATRVVRMRDGKEENAYEHVSPSFPAGEVSWRRPR